MRLVDRVDSTYFIGVAGIGMSSVAAALKQRGQRVGGSDQQFYPPASEILERAGVLCYSGYHADHIRDFNPALVVIGNSVSRGNPEVEYVLSRRIPFLSLPELVQHELISEATTVIVVTGTHGKTTTSSLIAWMLDYAHFAPGFFIGSIPGNFPTGFRYCGNSHGGNIRIAVLEGDEYDTAFFDKRSKFLHYFPSTLVINNLEYDHADIFPDIEALLRQFRHLLRLLPQDGMLLVNGDDAHIAYLLNTSEVYTERICRFGQGEENDVRFEILQRDADGNTVRLRIREQIAPFFPHLFQQWANVARQGREGELVQEFRIPFPGDHMAYNAIAAILAVHPFVPLVPAERIQGALNTFRLPRRRLEQKAAIGGVIVYEDFAHHPTALRASLQALRQRYADRRLLAAVEPRSNTMVRRVFQQELRSALLEADVLFFAPPYRYQRYAPEQRLDVADLAAHYRAQGKVALAVPSHLWDAQWPQWLVEHIVEMIRPGDVLVFFSNGSFAGIVDQIVKQLELRGQTHEL